MLLLRQVDDFAVACPAEDIAKRLHAQIGKALQLPSEDVPPFKHLGLIKDFNGLDVAQCSDAIKLSCECWKMCASTTMVSLKFPLQDPHFEVPTSRSTTTSSNNNTTIISI